MTKRILKLTVVFVVVGLAVLAAFVATNTWNSQATAQTQKEFQMVAVEWKTTISKPSPYDPINDRGEHPVGTGQARNEINHYAWDPSFIVVNKGDKVVLKIHGVNGDVHDIDIAGVDFTITGRTGIDGKGKAPIAAKPEVFTRGEEITVEFTATDAGLFEILCSIHDEAYATAARPELKDDGGVTLDSAKKVGDAVKGPMIGYLLVLP